MQSTDKPKQKSYRQGSGLYFSAGLLLSMVLIITAFEWKSTYRILDKPVEFEDTTIVDLDFKTVYIPPKPKPPVLSQDIVEVTDTRPETEEPPIEVPPIDEDDEGMEEDIIDSLLTGSNPFGREETEMPEINKDAAPVDGIKAFYDYLYKNLRIPDHLLEQGGEHRITVSFVVDTNGQITDIQVAEGTDKSMEKQLVKLLQNGPAWESAWQHGRKVKVRKALPVVIKTNR